MDPYGTAYPPQMSGYPGQVTTTTYGPGYSTTSQVTTTTYVTVPQVLIRDQLLWFI